MYMDILSYQVDKLMREAHHRLCASKNNITIEMLKKRESSVFIWGTKKNLKKFFWI